MALTPKQARFVQEYIVDMNATQAAIRAGYSQDTAGAIGWENLQKPEISDGIAQAQQDMAARASISQDWVMARLKDVAIRCLQAEPVLDREGNETGEYRFSDTGANRSLELIGKHLGMFIDRKADVLPDGSPVPPTTMLMFAGVAPGAVTAETEGDQ